MTDAVKTPDSKTHRCVDCPHWVEHYQAEICTSCGRCNAHCADHLGKPKRRNDA